MFTLHLISLLTMILLFLACFVIFRYRNSISAFRTRFCVYALFAAAFIIRIIFGYFEDGYSSDISCFYGWAIRLYEVGFKNFYSPDVFSDYPPGYLYILYPLGAIIHSLNLKFNSGIILLLLKFPSIISDITLGILIYREGKKRFSEGSAFMLTFIYLYNPCVILNSSVWGQVDSILTLFIICTCLSIIEDRMILSYFFFALGILFKPQILIFTPILIAAFVDKIILDNFCIKNFCKNIFSGLCALLMLVLFSMPFGLEKVLTQYTDTLSSYPYASVNAYNFWSFLGLNWYSQDSSFCLIPIKTWGAFAIIGITVSTLLLSILMRRHNIDYAAKYHLLAAFLYIFTFTFSARMHERYLYPAIICLLFAYICTSYRKIMYLYVAVSILHFYNTAHILYFYNSTDYNASSLFVRAISLGTVLCAFYMCHIIYEYFLCDNRIKKCENASLNLKNFNKFKDFTFSKPKMNITKTDLVLITVITVLYSGFALYDLGYKYAPSTLYEMNQGDSVTLYFDTANNRSDLTESFPASISCYIAPVPETTVTFDVWGSTGLSDYEYLGKYEIGNVFKWCTSDIDLKDNSIIWLGITGQKADILELVIQDAGGNILTPLNASDYPALFDEQAMFPKRSTFRDSTYFDEIYHARTAYEFLNGLNSYENTHPPLGKIFIMSGIAIFGMNPFGWRIIGVLFGILMIPFMYFFAKKITDNIPTASLAAIIFSFDFMHFTQTRIATIDVYITFFIILMYFFMYCYSRLSFYDAGIKKTLIPLAACGICMGLGMACKWTGVYAGMGLFVIFASVMLKRFTEYRHALAEPGGMTKGILHREIIQKFKPSIVKTICTCIVFFVVIPCTIYLLSYIPFRDYNENTGLVTRMLNNQRTMFDYHSKLNATHPFSSPWYTWPLMEKPIWYYSGVIDPALREGISAFGNPLVWWLGIPAFFFNCIIAIKKKDSNAAFLVTAYVFEYLPWVFVTRITFIYHYFTSVPFVVLMICYSLIKVKEIIKLNNRKYIALISVYAGLVFLLFILFYPVLSGEPVDKTFVSTYLRWGKDWILTAN